MTKSVAHQIAKIEAKVKAQAGAEAEDQDRRISLCDTIHDTIYDMFSQLFAKPETNPEIPASKYSLFPIQNLELWQLYKQAVASFWTVEEVYLDQDKEDWNKLSDNTKHFLKNVLSFFAVSDGIVNANLLMNFANEVEDSASLCFYGFQIAMENIHAEMYSQLIEAYVSNKQERIKLFDGITNNASIRAKAKWCLGYTNNQIPFQQRLVAFAIVEGIFFSASFASIFWLKKRGLMPGLTFSNELISRDEALHTQFACAKYHTGRPIAAATVHAMIRSAVDAEHHFVDHSLQSKLIGMNSTLLRHYVQFVADHLCVALRVPKLYNTANPFEWMVLISLQGKTNFFERRVSEYSKAGVGVDSKEQVFDTELDF